MSLVRIISRLEKLASEISGGNIGNSEPWHGADVLIRNDLPAPQSDSFYPSPRYVITEHVRQLSWLFENARDAFVSLEGYGFWKEELFGRLGNAANRYIGKQPSPTVQKLLLAVVHEAFAVVEEMQIGEFRALSISINNDIYDDLFREIESEGLAEKSEVDAYIKSLGIDL
jgi:hypothetical protein